MVVYKLQYYYEVIQVSNIIFFGKTLAVGSIIVTYKRGQLEVFCKRGALKILQNSYEKTTLRVPFLSKFQASVWLWDRCFPVSFAMFIRAPFFIKRLRWLLLRSLSWFALALDLPPWSLLDCFCWKSSLLEESIKRYSKSVFWINRVINL